MRHLAAMAERILHLGLVEDEAIMLDAAALELAALDHPGFDLEPSRALLDEATERLAGEADAAETIVERARLLGQVLAVELGLTGDAESYDDPANADLIEVLARRRGLPVSLSILYVALARRVGWVAAALNTPGHVVVRIGDGSDALLVDPFHGGRIIEPGQLDALLSRMIGRPIGVSPALLAPMSNREVLTRLLLNQATRAEASGDPARALVLYDRMTALAPGTANLLWEKARLELIESDVPAARASLTSLLEITREPRLRARVNSTLDSIARLER